MTASSKTDTKMGHTPGPWTAFYKSKYDEWHVSLPISGSGMKLSLAPDGIQSENREADARLIAAAPEMLEAVKAGEVAIKQMDGLPGFGRVEEQDSPMNDVLRAFRAAIAKATGAAS